MVDDECDGYRTVCVEFKADGDEYKVVVNGPTAEDVRIFRNLRELTRVANFRMEVDGGQDLCKVSITYIPEQNA